jgi:hypothetical protein
MGNDNIAGTKKEKVFFVEAKKKVEFSMKTCCVKSSAVKWIASLVESNQLLFHAIASIVCTFCIINVYVAVFMLKFSH